MIPGVRKYTIWLLVLATLSAAGAIHFQAMQKERDIATVGSMTAEMKTICVGRFLIDLPEEAQVELTHSRIHGFDIAAFDEPTAEFQARLTTREQEIKAKPDRLGGNENLESVTEITADGGVPGKIFVHTRNVTEGTRARGLELERYRYEGVAVEALVHANGTSIDLATEDYDPDRIANMAALVAKLVPNPTNKIPAVPGFCINRAYFLDPLKADQREQIMMFAKLPSRPDIGFMLILAAGGKPDEEGLLERDSAATSRLALFERMRLTKLRAGERVIGGLSGEEVIKSANEENDAKVYSFWWEVNGSKDDVFVPHLVLRMVTGKGKNGPVPSSVSEGAALGLWNKISSSIRLRPTVSPAISEAESAQPPRVPQRTDFVILAGGTVRK